MDGPGIPDDLIRDHGRPSGSGFTAGHDPLGLPDTNRDAVVEAGDAPPHPVGAYQRPPNSSAERMELVGLLGPIQGVYRNDHHVRENAHGRDGRFILTYFVVDRPPAESA